MNEHEHVVLGPDGTSKVAERNYPFKQARHFRWGRPKFAYGEKGPIWIVLHGAECAETRGAAEALQSYAATMADGRVASWHFACDADSTTQSVRIDHTAFHAPPINGYSIGIECAGRSAQLASDWDDPYSHALITTQLQPLLALLCKWEEIVPRLLSDEDLAMGLRLCSGLSRGEALEKYSGIVPHSQVARVFRKSTHSDPGKGFPLARVVQEVAKLVEEGEANP